MKKTISVVLKVIIFFCIFWVIMAAVAFFIRCDIDPTSRSILEELQGQSPVDLLFCGGERVRSGLKSALLDSIIAGKGGEELNSYSFGMAGEGPLATKAVIEAALEAHPELKEVWFECDWTTIEKTNTLHKDRKPDSFTYIISRYIKDKGVRSRYLKEALAPQYYLSFLMPLGGRLTLNPKEIIKIIKNKFNKKDESIDSTSIYSGRGCLLRTDAVKNGSFLTEGESLIDIGSIGGEFYDSIRAIKDALDVRGGRLVLYCAPVSPFFLLTHKNYDQYIMLIKDFCDELGVDYFDFSLAKDDLLKLTDSDYTRDNQLNITGVEKFTKAFALFYSDFIKEAGKAGVAVTERFGSVTANGARLAESYWANKYFYSSFTQKLAASGPRVYGTEAAVHYNALVVRAVGYRCKDALITGRAHLSDGTTLDLTGVATGEAVRFAYPPDSHGAIEIKISLDGVEEAAAFVDYFWL